LLSDPEAVKSGQIVVAGDSGKVGELLTLFDDFDRASPSSHRRVD
jgi:hypothetical protein